MNSGYEDRINTIFQFKSFPRCNKRNLLKYRSYLLNHFDKDTIVTGDEDFPWEDSYIYGKGNPDEYEMLKQICPMSNDDYTLLDISTQIEHNDLIATIRRLSDGSSFQVGLSWLRTRDPDSKEFTLLKDYATWSANL